MQLSLKGKTLLFFNRLFFIVALLVLFVRGVQAASIVSIDRKRAVASADLTNLSGKADFEVSFHRIDDDSLITTGDKIFWTNNNEILSGPRIQWLSALSYAKISSTITMRTGSIQIYTDNANRLQFGSGLPPYDMIQTLGKFGIFASDIDSVFSESNVQLMKDLQVNLLGLYPVTDNGTSVQTVGEAIPLAWRVSTDKLSGDDLKPQTQIVNQEGHIGIENGPVGFYPWFYVLDLSQKYGQNSGDMGQYSRVSRAALGVQVSEGYFARDSDSTQYIYFAADFSQAEGNLTYKSNIVMEAFSE